MDTLQTYQFFFLLNQLPNLVFKWPGCLTRNHGNDSVRWSSRSVARPTEWEALLRVTCYLWFPLKLPFFLGSNCTSRMFVNWAGPEQQINRRNFVSRVLFSDKVGRGTCLESMQGKLQQGYFVGQSGSTAPQGPVHAQNRRNNGPFTALHGAPCSQRCTNAINTPFTQNPPPPYHPTPTIQHISQRSTK